MTWSVPQGALAKEIFDPAHSIPATVMQASRRAGAPSSARLGQRRRNCVRHPDDGKGLRCIENAAVYQPGLGQRGRLSSD